MKRSRFSWEELSSHSWVSKFLGFLCSTLNLKLWDYFLRRLTIFWVHLNGTDWSSKSIFSFFFFLNDIVCLFANHIIIYNLIIGHLGELKRIKEENKLFIIPIIQKQPLLSFWYTSFQIYSLKLFRHHNSKGISKVKATVVIINFTGLSSLQQM